jgi:hypothetical protein
LDSSRLDTTVAGYQRKAKVESSGGNDAVGHVGNNITGNFRERVGHAGINWGDEKSRVRISES